MENTVVGCKQEIAVLDSIFASDEAEFVAVYEIAPEKVIVEARQKKLIKQLKQWGIETIPCPFAHYEPYEGSFHCATLDIRRRGVLESYF